MILLVSALKTEIKYIEHPDKIITGIGKVEATLGLTLQLSKFVNEYKPIDHVVNFGTAGTDDKELLGKIVECISFHEWDLNLKEIGIHNDRMINSLSIWGGPNILCMTGDQFKMPDYKLPWAIYDMEAYAYARVCESFRIPFHSFKYITNTRENAMEDWIKNSDEGARALAREWPNIKRRLSTS